jgi:hypothetical protein
MQFSIEKFWVPENNVVGHLAGFSMETKALPPPRFWICDAWNMAGDHYHSVEKRSETRSQDILSNTI